LNTASGCLLLEGDCGVVVGGTPSRYM